MQILITLFEYIETLKICLETFFHLY